MSALGPMFVALVIIAFLFCAAMAIAPALLSGKIRHEENAGLHRSRHPANTN